MFTTNRNVSNELILRGPQNMTFHGATVGAQETEGYPR